MWLKDYKMRNCLECIKCKVEITKEHLEVYGEALCSDCGEDRELCKSCLFYCDEVDRNGFCDECAKNFKKTARGGLCSRDKKQKVPPT